MVGGIYFYGDEYIEVYDENVETEIVYKLNLYIKGRIFKIDDVFRWLDRYSGYDIRGLKKELGDKFIEELDRINPVVDIKPTLESEPLEKKNWKAVRSEILKKIDKSPTLVFRNNYKYKEGTFFGYYDDSDPEGSPLIASIYLLIFVWDPKTELYISTLTKNPTVLDKLLTEKIPELNIKEGELQHVSKKYGDISYEGPKYIFNSTNITQKSVSEAFSIVLSAINALDEYNKGI